MSSITSACTLAVLLLVTPLSAQQVDVFAFGNATSVATYTGPGALQDALTYVAGVDNMGVGGSAPPGTPNIDIVAQDGTYDGPLVIGPYLDLFVRLASVTGPNVTHIVGGNPVIGIEGSVSEPSHIVEGFDITSEGFGRGIIIDGGGSLIDTCFIHCCQVTGNGAGIYAFTSQPATLASFPVIEDCVIWDCQADDGHGGGVALIDTNARLEGNRIVGNRAVTDLQGGANFGNGGGVYQRLGFVTLEDNTIQGNTAGLDGGGMWVGHGLPQSGVTVGAQLDRNRIVDNRVTSDTSRGAGVFFQSAFVRGDYPAILRMNSIVANGRLVEEASKRPSLGGGVFIGLSIESFLLNNTFWANEAVQEGGGCYIDFPGEDETIDQFAHVINCLFWDNTLSAPVGGLTPTPDLQYSGNPNQFYQFVNNVSLTQVITNRQNIIYPEFAHFGDGGSTDEPLIAASIAWAQSGGGDYGLFDTHQLAQSPHAFNGSVAAYTGLVSVSSTAAAAISLTPALDIDLDPVPSVIPGISGAFPIGCDLRDRRGYLWGGLPYESGDQVLLGASGFSGETWYLFYSLFLDANGLPMNPALVGSFVFTADGAFSTFGAANPTPASTPNSGITESYFLSAIGAAAPYAKTVSALPNMIDTLPRCPEPE